jgi:hypothetical protein
MKTTTEYIQRVTITTDDDGARTITRTSHADTCTEYLFRELSEDAQQRAISDAIAEEVDGAYTCSQIYFTTEEILGCAHDLTKAQPIEITQDYGCSWYGTARGEYWHHPADWQSVTEAENNGICFSMDMCDAWNPYAARIVALQEGHEDAEERAYIHDENADNAADNGNTQTAEAERRRAAFYEDMAERIEEAAEELTEEAARAVGAVVDGLINDAWEYYQSPEFWREWLDDGETRFTREGERI